MSMAIRLSMKHSVKLPVRLSCRLLLAAAALLLAAAFSLPLHAQDGNTSGKKQGYVDDWSTHRLLFSNPGTREDAIRHGKLNQWLAVTNSVRYQMQQLERNRGALTGIGTNFSSRFGGRMPVFGSKSKGTPIQKDWQMPLGGLDQPFQGVIGDPSTITGGSTYLKITGMTANPVTLTASAPTQGTQTGTFSGDPTSGGYVTITNGTNALKLTIGAASSTTISMHGTPNYQDTIGIGSITYEFVTYNHECSGSSYRCVEISSSNSTTATYLTNAIGGACFDSKGCPTAGNDPSVAASHSNGSSSVTIYNATTSPVSLTTTDATNIYLAGISQTSATLAAPSGTNGCTSSTAGTFINPDSTSALATQLAAAITNCTGSYSTVDVTATSTGSSGVVTLTAVTPGQYTITLGDSLSNFSWTHDSMAGTNGATTTNTTLNPTFAYYSGTTYATVGYASATAVATNMYTALNDDADVTDYVTVTNPSNGEVDLAVANFGAGPYSVSTSNFSAISPTSGSIATPIPAAVQPDAFPAKYGTSISSASCSDFVVFPTGQEGSGTAATIIAYTNLYSSCPAYNNGPTVAWAYNTHSGYAVTTSPSISEDGSSVIFVESNGTDSELVVLHVVTGDSTASVTAPDTPIVIGNIGNCVSPDTACVARTPLSGHDTYSAPYYTYYDNDTVFVGTDDGQLDEISPILFGALGEAQIANLTGAEDVSSPVFDANSGCVFVGDTNGYLYSVDPGFGSGTVCNTNKFGTHAQSVQLAASSSSEEGIYDGPLVDSNAGTVYAFVTYSAAEGNKKAMVTVSPSIGNVNTVTFTAGALTTADIGDTIVSDSLNILKNYTITNVSGTTATLNNDYYYFSFSSGSDTLTLAKTPAGDNAVDEFPTNFADGASPSTSATVGTGGAGYPLYTGAFDNTYYTTGTGHIWVVGGTGTNLTGASLYSIPVSRSSGITGAYSSSTTVTLGFGASYPWPSPVSEFENGSTDYLFFSVADASPTVPRGGTNNCTASAGNGCILSYTISGTTATYSGDQNFTSACWATGGIVIDNSDTTTGGASQLYFVDLNGAAAGGEYNGTTINPTGSCTGGSPATLIGIQGAQANP